MPTAIRTEKYCAYNPEGTKCNYPQHEGQDSGYFKEWQAVARRSVALHRIAYLLYHDREHLNSSNILILSPGGVFADYISHILPELGEENIQEMSF